MHSNSNSDTEPASTSFSTPASPSSPSSATIPVITATTTTKTRSLPLNFMLAAMSTTSATCFSNPIEVIKTRMQLQGELQTNHKKHYKGIFSSLIQIVRNEGIFAIQKGLTPGLFYQFFMNGTRLGSYQFLQKKFSKGQEDQYFYLKSTQIDLA